jgi:NADPH2:quinone reductase
MRALVVRRFGAPDAMNIEELDLPVPAAGEVRIRVMVAGVSFVDALTVVGGYQIRPPLPWIPGSECAGVVDAVGAEVVAFAPGDRVCAFAWGGVIAEMLCVAASDVTALPAAMDFETGAVIRVAYTTAWHALVDRAQLAATERLLVLGATGAVGHAAIEIGKVLGAHVIAAAATPEKRRAALAAGADAAVESGADGLRRDVETLAGRKAIDVVLDPVGGATSEPAFRLLGPGGRHCVVGFAAGGAIPGMPLNLPLLIGGSVLGVNVAHFSKQFPDAAAANFQRILRLFGEGRIAPRVAHRFTLDRAAAAFDCARLDRPIGRVVINR